MEYIKTKENWSLTLSRIDLYRIVYTYIATVVSYTRFY